MTSSPAASVVSEYPKPVAFMSAVKMASLVVAGLSKPAVQLIAAHPPKVIAAGTEE